MSTAHELDWLAGVDPLALLESASSRLVERHYRRVAAGWCQLISPLLASDIYRPLLDQIELVAEGSAGSEMLDTHRWFGANALYPYPRTRAEEAIFHACFASHRANSYLAMADQYLRHVREVSQQVALAWGRERIGPSPPDVGVNHSWHARFNAVCNHVKSEQANLVRCVIANPFRPVAFDPHWRTGTAMAVARQMYESREFSGMPILADALQDAGCENADILDHCRGPGPHVRGCWVIDLVLGYS